MKTFLKIVLWALLGFIVLIIALAIFYNPNTPVPVKGKSANNPKMISFDLLYKKVKHDTIYNVKDVYYNPKDSSFNIAISDKEKGDIKYHIYSVDEIDKIYHITDFPQVDGITLYKYKKGKYLSKGDYSVSLESNSKRGKRIYNAFKNKYCYGNHCEPIENYIKTNLNDPSSYEADKLWVEWQTDSLFTVTCTYRAKNEFGAIILSKASATIDINGNVTDFTPEY